ncbi:MAG TPA: hypothetical protein VGD67_09425 [Pseudonocardiaceae bacterium]
MDDEEFLNTLSQPVELVNLETPVSAPLTLNAEWVAYLDQADLGHQVAGIDPSLHHFDHGHEEGSAYA